MSDKEFFIFYPKKLTAESVLDMPEAVTEMFV